MMAIKEPCDDVVSRKDVLNTLDFTDKFLDKTRTVESYKTLLEECYKNLPSVTPIHKDRTVQDFVDRCRECGKQKKGKWVKSNIGGAKVCSICQTHMGLSNFKFCPNCGAEMSYEQVER